MDMSFMAKFRVEGPAAGAVLDRLSANAVDGETGTITYTQWLNERGRIEADLTVTKLEPGTLGALSADGRAWEPAFRDLIARLVEPDAKLRPQSAFALLRYLNRHDAAPDVDTGDRRARVADTHARRIHESLKVEVVQRAAGGRRPSEARHVRVVDGEGNGRGGGLSGKTEDETQNDSNKATFHRVRTLTAWSRITRAHRGLANTLATMGPASSPKTLTFLQFGLAVAGEDS